MDNIRDFLIAEGLMDQQQVMDWLRHLPYGRNTDRANPLLLMSEGKGTCSTKHAFFKLAAQAMKWSDVQLYTGIYKMQEQNTPGIGAVLEQHQLEYLPEAHCYLKINQQYQDLTSPKADFSLIEPVLMKELEIQPHQIGDFKVNWHQDFLKKWIQEENLPYSFEKIWAVREDCILALSQ